MSGHHVDSYIFGDGSITFPRWFQHKYPGLKLYHMDRQVGARHGILLKNAMVHYTMFEPYLSWCSHVKHEVQDGNKLHTRVLTKLQTIELKGIIRARGIFYVKVHHVLLCALKSKVRAATQADVCMFLAQLKDFCVCMKEDATFMLDVEGQKLFGEDTVVQRVHKRWCTTKNNRVLISNLLRADSETEDMTITCLQAYAASTIKQLDSNSAEYLPGGKINTLVTTSVADLSPQQLQRRKHVLTCPTTSDPIERVFGIFDYDLTAHTNLSMISASGMTCYRMNRTREWLEESLPSKIRTLVIDMSRRMFSKTLHERNNMFKSAIDGKHRKRLEKMAKVTKARFTRLKQMLKYNEVAVILTMSSWTNYKV